MNMKSTHQQITASHDGDSYYLSEWVLTCLSHTCPEVTDQARYGAGNTHCLETL